jgi:serine protease
MPACWKRSLTMVLAGLATCMAAWSSPPEPATPRAAGLIVRLQAAPDHGLEHERALASDNPQSRRNRQAERWRRLLAATGLARESGLVLEPAGRASWRLSPRQPWTAAEATRWRARLAARPEVAWVVSDSREPRLQSALPSPDDPLFAGPDGQWWLQPVSGSDGNLPEARRRGVPGLQGAWAISTGHADTVIAVLDSGWTAHPDLDPARVLPGYDMVSDWDAVTGRGAARDGDGRDADARDPGDWVSADDLASDPGRYAGCAVEPSGWHGTAVAGLIAAQTGNGLGGAGIDAAAHILPVRIAGACGATVRDIVDGLRWAAGLAVCRRYADALAQDPGCAEWAPLNPHPARIINLSYGGPSACNAEYQDAIDELWARGVVVVAAAGNAHGAPTRPANCAKVIGVAALNRDGFKANYSNFGATLSIATVGGDDTGGAWGGLLADSGLLGPGNLGSRAPGAGSYGARYGTSYAAPLVSGTLGLMLAVHPGLGAAEMREGLMTSARPHVRSPWVAECSSANPGRCLCTRSTCGAGMLDAPQALAFAQAARDGAAYLAPNWPTVQIDTAELRLAAALGPDREAAAGQDPAEPPGQGGGALEPLALLMLAGLARGLRRPRKDLHESRKGRSRVDSSPLGGLTRSGRSGGALSL